MTLAAHPPASPRCLDPEEVAAFLDGRLTGRERQAVVEHAAGCQDCYELLTETGRAVLEEEAAAVPPLRSWTWPLLAAAGVVLSVATGVLLLRRPATVDVAGLVDALPVSAAAPYVSAPVQRGPAPAGAAAVDAGALLVDLRVAARAGDEGRGRAVLLRLASLLDAAGFMGDDAQRCRAAAAAFDGSRWAALAADLEGRLRERFPAPELNLGLLLEATRLAAATRSAGFLTPARGAALESARGAVSDAALRARLEAVRAAWDQRSLADLERACADALATARAKG